MMRRTADLSIVALQSFPDLTVILSVPTTYPESLGLGRQPRRQLVPKLAGLVEVVVLDIGRGYLDPEVLLVVRALPEVTKEGQQRMHLATFIGEVNAVGEDAATFHPFSLQGLEVVLPVTATTDDRREGLPLENLPSRVRLHERSHRDVRRQPPRGCADNNQVVLPFRHGIRDRDLHGLVPQLCRDHAEHLPIRLLQRERLESLLVAGVSEFDLRKGHVT